VPPGEALIDVLVQTRLGAAATLDERLDLAPLLREALAVSPYLSAIYAGDRHVDPELFERFLTAGAYREYAERFLAPEQIDAVDVAAYVGGR